MGASINGTLGYTKNICGLYNGDAYTILSAFNMTDASGKIN